MLLRGTRAAIRLHPKSNDSIHCLVNAAFVA
jgi:hypothetical protein